MKNINQSLHATERAEQQHGVREDDNFFLSFQMGGFWLS